MVPACWLIWGWFKFIVRIYLTFNLLSLGLFHAFENSILRILPWRSKKQVIRLRWKQGIPLMVLALELVEIRRFLAVQELNSGIRKLQTSSMFTWVLLDNFAGIILSDFNSRSSMSSQHVLNWTTITDMSHILCDDSPDTSHWVNSFLWRIFLIIFVVIWCIALMRNNIYVFVMNSV